MKNLLKLPLACILTLTALTGCTIKQEIKSAEVANNAELCIIEDTDVRAGFLKAFEKSLQENQVKYRVTNSEAAKSCEWTAKYTANWAWDLALYMVYAEIKVYQNEKLAGEAIYDARRGGGNMNKFIDADEKIKELVDQLIEQKQASLQLNHPFSTQYAI